jgi:Tol biopolymer transport system component
MLDVKSKDEMYFPGLENSPLKVARLEKSFHPRILLGGKTMAQEKKSKSKWFRGGAGVLIFLCVIIMAVPAGILASSKEARSKAGSILGLFSPTATASLTPTFTATSTPKAAGGGRILFVSNRNGNSEIYRMDSDGSNLTRLTNDTVKKFNPVSSPDGKRIAFASVVGNYPEIYVMDSDGSNLKRLTANEAYDYDPTWSPDGKRIAFWTNRDGGESEIYVMDSDGSNAINLTQNTWEDFNPNWSRDGTRIVYVSDPQGYTDIFTMNPDGSGITQLTNDSADEYGPSWSPDGTRIAFYSTRTLEEFDHIYIMNADGSNEIQLTDSADLTEIGDGYAAPAWSADGMRIALACTRGGNSEICLMDPDGSNMRQLTNNPAQDYDPSWMP